jgi:ubiquinone/menaquinone biosynthesis C-methylase UbiE
MTDTQTYIQRLVEANPLREPVLRAVVSALELGPGSRGLDAGCGVGLQAVMLAEAIGPDGHVTGVDIAPELLRYAERVAQERGLADRISYRVGDVAKLPFDDDSFDWAWSVDCAGYPAGDLLPVLRELVRVVIPGGTVAVLAWTAQSLLPGYPLVEASLNATCSAYAPYVSGWPPQSQFLRALQWFREAGLEDAAGRTFAGDVQAPLSAGVRNALISLFSMLWAEPQPGAAPPAWAEYQRLCRPESPDFVLDLPDYYAFFTYTMFRGRVPSQRH